jgi:hypothetical protein
VWVSKTCQRCGTDFACGLSCCWCDEIALAPHVAAALRERCSDCLCRSCLLAAIDALRLTSAVPGAGGGVTAGAMNGEPGVSDRRS